MMEDMKKLAKPYLTLYACAAVIALVGMAALRVMGRLGILEYSYRVAESPIALEGTLFDKLTVVLTGSTFVGFLFVAGLVLSLATASVLLYAHLSKKWDAPARRPWAAAVWGLATAVVSFAVGAIAAMGLFSGVQISLVAGSGGSGGGGMAPVAVLLLLAVGSLIAAAMTVARTCALGDREGAHVARRFVIAVALCSVLVAMLTAGTFGAMNAQPADSAATIGWLVADIVANCALMTVADHISR